MTRRNLKGSRKLQVTLPDQTRFTGGVASGAANAGGSAGGAGSAKSAYQALYSNPSSFGTGEFGITGGSSGFVNTVSGTAAGTAAAGATGSQSGAAKLPMGATMGDGILAFAGTTDANGRGSFDAGFSPVQFNTVTTTIPGIPASGGSSKKDSSGGSTDPTFVTTVIPVSTGATGGTASGSGSFNINSGATGKLSYYGGTGSSTGKATNFGGGSSTATNALGSAGGLASGAGTGAASGGGTVTAMMIAGPYYTSDIVGTGNSNGNFNNVGSGIFGGSSNVLTIP
jgi:hypothetical protein